MPRPQLLLPSGQLLLDGSRISPKTPLPAPQPVCLQPQTDETQRRAGKATSTGPCHPDAKCVCVCVLTVSAEWGRGGGADAQQLGRCLGP